MSINMYLKKYNIKNEYVTPDELVEINKFLVNKRQNETYICSEEIKRKAELFRKDFAEVKYGFGKVKEKYRKFTCYKEVGHWRGTNAVHTWFVDNVQNGYDNGGAFKVEKEQLKDLLCRCEKVVNESIMMANPKTFDENFKNEIPPEEIEKIIINPEVAMEYLPVTEDASIGPFGYDDFYIADIEYTIEVLNKVLKETDWDKEIVFYQSRVRN